MKIMKKLLYTNHDIVHELEIDSLPLVKTFKPRSQFRTYKTRRGILISKY